MIKIKILLLPKFELNELTGETPGEAQAFYREYFKNSESYTVRGGYPGSKLCVNARGAAMYITGMGKVNVTASLTALLSDTRFDFSEALILSIGCAGGSAGYAVMGDVFVLTSAADFDIGHHADIRDMENRESPVTWFHDASYDDVSITHMNSALTERIYALVRDISLDTTPRTQRFMAREFKNAPWALRAPKVLKGSTVSSDNFWKGAYDHNNAEYICRYYGCQDPYALCEMEDSAIGAVLRRFSLESHYAAIRACVNMDVFMNGDTPEKLWNPAYQSTMIASDDNTESADIFPTAMQNNFRVVSTLISAVLDGKFDEVLK